jgi:hypothetical protein
MSALGQKPTYALQQAMSALHPIATAKADFRTRSCLLYPRKRTCAVQLGMSALGQKRTHAVQQKDRYSITSLARATSEAGTVMPSTFAVLRLMTSSSLVGNSIGKWATGVPLSILYTYVAAR